jgi:hypothetical protein
MVNLKSTRPAFQAVELDPIDARLEAKAIEKGIPTLVTHKTEAHPVAETVVAAEPVAAPSSKTLRAMPKDATPRSRMRGLKIELPDYVWVALKKKAAEEMVSLRHVIMTALRDKGIHINEADMIEDGRRFRD